MFSRAESGTPSTLIPCPFWQRAPLQGHKRLLTALVTQLYQECNFLLILTSSSLLADAMLVQADRFVWFGGEHLQG